MVRPLSVDRQWWFCSRSDRIGLDLSSGTAGLRFATLLWPIWKFREGEEYRRVEGRRVVERRVEGNSYPPLYLDVFKISKGEVSNQLFLLFGCFKNYDGNERKMI